MFCGSTSRLAKAAGSEPSGQMRDEKLHAGVARRRFQGQNGKSKLFSKHFWKLSCRKSARDCAAKQISESKVHKTHLFRSTFGSSDVDKVQGVVAQDMFGSEHVKKPRVRSTFVS